MKDMFILLVSIFLFFGACSKSEEKIDFSLAEERNGLVFKIDDDEPYTGTIYGLYEDETKKAERNYKNGKLEGLSVFWYSNGNVDHQGTYKDGKLDGPSAAWYPYGEKSNEGNYLADERVGLWTWWMASGVMTAQGNYENGSRNGIWQMWNQDRQRWEEKQYLNGFLLGGGGILN